MKLATLNLIKAIWKSKLTNNFNPKKELFNIYVDSPFCIFPSCKFCCYSPSLIKNKEESKSKDNYYDKILIKQIQEFKDILKIRTPDTFYFGGGSSSLMSSTQMKKLFEEFQKHFDFKNKPLEKTFEMNPLYITDEKLSLLSHWKFTHTTIGVQTFDKKVLKFNERINIPINKLKELFKKFEKRSFEYNLDLMTFIYKKNTSQDLKILKKDLKISTQILKPNRITIFPNYYQLIGLHQINNKLSEEHPKVFEKVQQLRDLLKEFDTKEYFLSEIPSKVTLENYKKNYYLFKKNKFTNVIYNCSGWKIKNCRRFILNQNVLSFGGAGDRKPYSYISDKFCYENILNKNKYLFKIIYANINY
ncbi:radical SAM protein [Candidatus Woesearchaeota archaeon]|nr:radical SAM protein [Candidatus Woesearchaeota archaeon]